MSREPVRQAGSIPYRTTRFGGVEILLVSLSGGGWGGPKGGIKKSSSATRTASMESLEEAGVLGVLEPGLGSYGFRKNGRKHEVEVYPLRVEQVLDRWCEEEHRIRIWVPIAEAPRLIRRPGLTRLVVKLRHRLLTRAVQRQAA